MLSAPTTARPPIDEDAAYRAWCSHDARFDGRLFVGVRTTGIYCRPVCRVRMPRRANMRFFHNAASAECAGFRPCLRCRPELAPGLALIDSSQALAQQAAQWLQDAVHAGRKARLPAVAERLGVTDRHLRRIFQSAHGVTPIAYLTTQRLLLAKQLLTDTDQPITAVAHASGFDSLRRFNAAFVERYRLQPSALRRAGRQQQAADREPRGATLRLAWRPPYDVDAMLAFLARRQLHGVEAVDGLGYRRTLAVEQAGSSLAGWLQLRFVPERNELHAEVSPGLAPALGLLLQRLRQAFDLDADPERIDVALARLPVAVRPGLRLPGGIDGFEAALRVVLGQQITVKAACTLARRLVERFGVTIETPFADLTRLFPTAATLAAADPAEIGRLGIVRQRVAAIQALAQAVSRGELALHRGAPLAGTLATLRALPGIGEWTAQVIAIRALAWPDAWPATDIGLHNALGSRDVRHITELAEAWRPWRAYAVMRLWHSLETKSS